MILLIFLLYDIRQTDYLVGTLLCQIENLGEQTQHNCKTKYNIMCL